MFERFTDRARNTIVHAQAEARALKHGYIGTEHLLLGLLREEEGIAAKVLGGLGVSAELVRSEIVSLIAPGKTPPTGHVPFTTRGRKSLELALREAVRLGHSYIGTEHILLGLLREGEGVAAQILTRRAISLGETREAVLVALGTTARAAAVGEVKKSVFRRRTTPRPQGPTCPQCEASLITNTAYRLVRVPDAEGEGSPAMTLFVYCTDCGHVLDDLIIPDEVGPQQDAAPRCSFCGADGTDGRRIIAGTGTIAICEHCLRKSMQILGD